MENADAFAKRINEVLDNFEVKHNMKFTSLRLRAVVLNRLGIPTRRNQKWCKTSVSRILKRKNNNSDDL